MPKNLLLKNNKQKRKHFTREICKEVRALVNTDLCSTAGNLFHKVAAWKIFRI